MVPYQQYIGRNPLALIHPEPCQSGGVKSMLIIRKGANNHSTEPHQLPLTTTQDFAFEE